MTTKPENGSGPEPIVARFRMTEADFLAIIAARSRRRPWRQWLFWAFIALNLLASLLFVWEATKRGETPDFGSYGNAIVAAVLVAVRYTVVPWNWRRLFARQKLGGKDVEATLTGEGISMKVGGFSSSADWTSLHDAERGKSHFLFWISEVQAFVLPFRGFVSDAQREAAWRLVLRMTRGNHDQ